MSEAKFEPGEYVIYQNRFYAAADKCLNCTKTKCTGNCKAVRA